MFRDEARLHVKGGKGGDGCVSFRREKYVPFGGPDGGDGGKGGDVVLVADENLNTLYHLVHIVRYSAQDAEPGGGNNCSGKSGHDLVIRVPPGTIIRDAEKDVVLKDLKEHESRAIVAHGGKGGRGNKAFATSVRQVPRTAEKGGPGEARTIELELKLIADAGFVGLPNAGKSTLLARISAARPKVADYPFTTLQPYLGIVSGGEYRTCVVADLPGLIEGAHLGAGLGDKFLRHIERTRIIVHMIDVSPSASQKPAAAYRVIRGELEQYSKDLAAKREIVVANKCDIPGSEKGKRALAKASGRRVIAISAATGEGIPRLINEIFKTISDSAEKL